MAFEKSLPFLSLCTLCTYTHIYSFVIKFYLSRNASFHVFEIHFIRLRVLKVEIQHLIFRSPLVSFPTLHRSIPRMTGCTSSFLNRVVVAWHHHVHPLLSLRDCGTSRYNVPWNISSLGSILLRCTGNLSLLHRVQKQWEMGVLSQNSFNSCQGGEGNIRGMDEVSRRNPPSHLA